MPNLNPTQETILDALMDRGHLVDLTVHQWSGQVGLDAADLGLAEGEIDSSKVSLGRRYIVDKSALDRPKAIAQRARNAVANYCKKFPIGGGYYAPNKVLGKLLAILAECRVEFEAWKESELAPNYHALCQNARIEWLAWADLFQRDHDLPEGWRHDFEARLDQAYPSREKVINSFSIVWTLFRLDVPKGLHEQVVDADRAEQAAMIALQIEEQNKAMMIDFLGERAVELRQKASEACDKIANRIKADGKITERSIAPLRDLIDSYRDLDFTEDSVFAQQLDAFKAEWLGPDSKSGIAQRVRNDKDFAESFSKALDVLSSTAMDQSDEAQSEAVERFLKFGKDSGRKLDLDPPSDPLANGIAGPVTTTTENQPEDPPEDQPEA